MVCYFINVLKYKKEGEKNVVISCINYVNKNDLYDQNNTF